MKRVIAIFLAIIVLLLTACTEKEQGASSLVESQTNSSNTSFTEEEIEQAEQQALILTEHIITYSISFESSNDLYLYPTDREIYDFMLTLLVYRENYVHPYYYIVKMEEEYVSYPLEDVQQMVYELFGIQDWLYPDIDLSQEEQTYIIPVGVGLPVSSYTPGDATVSSTSDGTIIVEFILTDSGYYEPASQEYGLHQITFLLMEEDGGQFLRFIEFRPV